MSAYFDQTRFQMLHEAVFTLRQALETSLGDLLPPYADEVLYDLEQGSADHQAEMSELRALFIEAESVMEMLPSVPTEWEAVHCAARTAGLAVVNEDAIH